MGKGGKRKKTEMNGQATNHNTETGSRAAKGMQRRPEGGRSKQKKKKIPWK